MYILYRSERTANDVELCVHCCLWNNYWNHTCIIMIMLNAAKKKMTLKSEY